MPKVIWKEEFLAQAYRLARAGESDSSMAAAMGIHLNTLKQWVKKRPSFAAMVEEGRRARDQERSSLSQTSQAHRYVHRRLPARLADFWATIKPAYADRSQLHLINLDVDSLAEEEQQLVYLHAVIECNYNHSRARMVCGLPLDRVNLWAKDARMRRWLKEVEESKKDFVEEALMDLVARRETSAVIFAARTLCRDRGYSDKLQVDLRADDQTAIDELRALTLEQRRLILEALEQKDRPRLTGPVTDVEYEEGT